MGINITELLETKEIEVSELKDKKIAIDASLFIYQFLTSIRQRDGTLLTDSKGNVTSHLIGIFSRTTKLMEQGIKPFYVFDGTAPELKNKERERRKKLKLDAEKKFNEAKEKEDIDNMRKYASRTTRLTQEILDESKKLISALGLPIVQAPSEGEAQASYIVKKGDAYAVASQDADSLMFGTIRLIRNLSYLGKRKKASKLSYTSIKPEMVTLSEVLNNLGIDNDQFIALGMLIGTDFNNGGIKGIGPKNGLKLVKKYGADLDSLFKEVKWDDFFEHDWTEVFYTIKKMKVTDEYSLEWKEPDKEKIVELLVEEHDFSMERVESGLKKLVKSKKEKEQKGLGEFF